MNKYNSSDFFKMAGIKASIDIETYERDMKEKEKELERYKNIIDELEKFLQEDIVYTSNTKADFISGILEANRLALNKLKELKGSDN